MLPTSIAVVTVLAGMFVWLASGDLIVDFVWGIRHQHTASFRGQTLRLPFLWRKNDGTNYNEFELSRSSTRFQIGSSVTVHYVNSTPEEAARFIELGRKAHAERQKKMEALIDQAFSEKASQRPLISNTDFHGDAFTEAHYVCLNDGVIQSRLLTLSCRSRDGRWNVSIWGLDKNLADFEMILHGVASMGNPSK
jgi:hypothetical protein